jgi:3-hydroxyisobutyrate dehydrogenase
MLKIGVIGIGLMGLPLVERLLAAGYSVTVYNRTADKLTPLQSTTAEIVGQPIELVDRVDCIILMLTDDRAIDSVLLTPQTLPRLTGKTILQMGTISPQASRQIRDRIVDAGGEYLEAPVLGSIPEAKTGKLLLMVGATAAQFDRYLPLLKTFGESPRLIGEVGTAAALKLALNQLISTLTTGFAQSLAYLQHQQVEIEAFMEILRSSAVYAPTFDKKLSRMLDRNYENPNFPTKHLLKDTDLFIESAAEIGINTTAIAGVKQILDLAIAKNLADKDYAALYEALADFDNVS